jgi:hypothetical protein
MILVWVLISGLAVYEASRSIASEEGPFSLFLRLRDRAGQATWLGRGIQCGSCLSFWGGLIAALLVGYDTWQQFLLLWGAIAGIATILWRVVG